MNNGEKSDVGFAAASGQEELDFTFHYFPFNQHETYISHDEQGQYIYILVFTHLQ